MFTGLILFFIYILQNFCRKIFSHLFIIVLLILFICLSQSTPISTVNNLASTNQWTFIANNSYRNFILRQYFIDLLNISHTSLVRSMIYNHHHLTSRSIRSVRQKRSNDEIFSSSPIFTLQSTNCLVINRQVQSTFFWSHEINSLSSVELIYHIDSNQSNKFSLPILIKFKHSQTLVELSTIRTTLQFDTNRDFYFRNIFEYIQQFKNLNLLIETIIFNQTCQTSHTYMIISSINLRQLSENELLTTPTNSSSKSCQVNTIQIKFEDLGLAYLIIRPKIYTFTFCDGICSYTTYKQQQQQSSMHALFQSIVNQKHPNRIPQPTCVPSQFADDNFLLRQPDGTMEIHPIKDVIVKQCACL